MIAKIILLIGMPGSGKTTIGNLMQSEAHPPDSSMFIDDLSLLTKNAKDFFNNLNTNNATQLIIADVFLCNESTRSAAMKIIQDSFPNAIIEPIFFENDPEKCISNVEHRISLGDDRKVMELIKTLTRNYTIPENSTVLRIKTGHSKNLKI